jgi:hypothetical protein
MHAICRYGGPGLLALLFLGPTPFRAGDKAPVGEVTVKLVKLPVLNETITGLKGHIVVVDFWATT